jgi:hypothetical protein
MASYAVAPGMTVEEMEEVMNAAPAPMKEDDEPKPQRRQRGVNEKDS